MITNKQIQLLEKLTNKKVMLENDFFKQHILSKEEKLERRLNSIRSLLIKGGTYKGGLNLSEIKGFDSLYNLERVEGSLDLFNTQIKDLGKLERVEGGLYLQNTQIKDLGNLEYVGGDLFLNNTQIESLGKLKHVGGYLSLHKTQIESLGKLEYVGGSIYTNSETPLFHNKELIEEYKSKGFKFN